MLGCTYLTFSNQALANARSACLGRLDLGLQHRKIVVVRIFHDVNLDGIQKDDDPSFPDVQLQLIEDKTRGSLFGPRWNGS